MRAYLYLNIDMINLSSKNGSYLLGLMYSDGFVSSKLNSCGFCLHSDDHQLMEDLISKFPEFKPLQTGKIIRAWCYDKKVINKLISYGVLSRKSYENKHQLRLPTNIKTTHFIRGFMDGDGSVGKDHIEIGGVCLELLNDIRLYLIENNIRIGEIQSKIPKRERDKQVYYRFAICGIDNMIQFYHLIYPGELKLNRKERKLYLICKEGLTKRYKYRCSRCNSHNVAKAGTHHSGKQTYHCKDCNVRSVKVLLPIAKTIYNSLKKLI